MLFIKELSYSVTPILYPGVEPLYIYRRIACHEKTGYCQHCHMQMKQYDASTILDPLEEMVKGPPLRDPRGKRTHHSTENGSVEDHMKPKCFCHAIQA